MTQRLRFPIIGIGAIVLAVSGFSIFSAERSAPAASQFRLFNSCYTLLTGKALHLDSPYLKRLKDGRISGPGLCKEILSSLRFDPKGRIVSTDGVAVKDLDLAVLERLQIVHQSFFNRLTFLNSEKEFATSAVMDVQEPANYLTWTLFAEQEAGQIFLTDLPPAAIRQTEVAQEYILEKDINMGVLYPRDHRKWLLLMHDPTQPWTEFGKDVSRQVEWHPDYIPMGRLVGFKHETPVRNPASIFEIPKTGFGGGVLGTQSYFSSNTGMPLGGLSDGGLLMHRRWSENVLKDFLCRDLPVLSEADVKDNVDRNSTVTFRKQADCMRCHQTMDTLAAGTRNLYVTWTGFDNTHPYFARIVKKTEGTAEADSRYAYSAPNGQFDYRNLDGRRIQFEFKSLSELGNHLASSKDFHYCLAKRYVKYFTGYDFDVQVKSGESLEAREFTRLADDFYSHKSQKRLLLEILDSPLFTRARPL